MSENTPEQQQPLQKSEQSPQDERLETARTRISDDIKLLENQTPFVMSHPENEPAQSMIPGGFSYESGTYDSEIKSMGLVIKKPPSANERPKGYEQTIPIMMYKRQPNSSEYSRTRVWVDYNDKKLPVYEAVRKDETASNVVEMRERPDLREDVIIAMSSFRRFPLV